MTKSEIKDFLKQWCDRAAELEMPDHMWELLMDDHRGICWYGVEYIMPEGNSFWTDFENEVAEHLYYNYAL